MDTDLTFQLIKLTLVFSSGAHISHT